MREDFSWDSSAKKYAASYERATIGISPGRGTGRPGGPERE
jgi:hypothetical protein